MARVPPRPVVRCLFVAAAATAATAAFLRGNYLMGFTWGVAYVVLTLPLLWLLRRSRTPAGVSARRVATVTVLAVPLGFGMAFPASVDPDFRVFIEKQATDRQARAELAAVFASDLAFHDLSVSSEHWKCVVFTVHGSVRSRGDFDRLRMRIRGECPTVGKCWLRWGTGLRDYGTWADGLDQDLFTKTNPDRKGK